MNEAVERAAQFIWESYAEPLSLDDIARSALLSRFHFARLFRDETGLSPCRFLSAVRIFQAKHMLLTTSTSITDIAFEVGYNSLGSFGNHFTHSVGFSPGRFRRIARGDGFALPGPAPDAARDQGVIAGTVMMPDGYDGARVYLGAFATPTVQHRAAVSLVMNLAAGARSAGYRMTGIPDGTWFVLAVGVADSSDPEPWTQRIALVGGGSVKLAAGSCPDAELLLRPRRPADPPVLLALPDLALPDLTVLRPAERTVAAREATSPRGDGRAWARAMTPGRASSSW